MELKDLEGAIDDYNKAIQINPQHAPAYFNRGSAFSFTGDCKRAISDLDEALRLAFDLPSIVNAANILKGQCLKKLGNREGALRSFEIAMQVAMENRFAEKAEVAIELLLQLDPNNADAYFYRGLINSSNNYSSAAADFSKSIQLNPKSASAFGNRGLLKLRHLNDPKGAISDFNQAIRIDSKRPYLYVGRGQAHFMAAKILMEVSENKEDTYFFEGDETKMLQDFQTTIQLLREQRDKDVESEIREILKSFQEMFSQFSPEPNIKEVQATLTELQQSLDKLDNK